MANTIPLIDVSALECSECATRRLVDTALHGALRDIGFAYIKGHGISGDEIKEVRETSKEFFSLSDDVKQAYELNQWHRGYLAPATSTIVTSTVANVKKPNQSESFLALSESNPHKKGILNYTQLSGPTQWPTEIPRMKAVCLAYMKDMEKLSKRLVHSIARGLELKECWFDDYFQRPTEFLRLLRYWPQELEDGLYGSAPHTDYGFLTLVAQDDIGGLEVCGRDGSWIAVPPIDGTFVLNVADILALWTGGVFSSTPHRVRNISKIERYSQPYFFDPSLETMISPITRLDEAEYFKPFSYGDYLMERLDKNYDYRKKLATG